MNAEVLYDILGDICEEYVLEAHEPVLSTKISEQSRKDKKDKSKVPGLKVGWLRWGAVAACLCMVVIGVVLPKQYNPLSDDFRKYNLGKGYSTNRKPGTAGWKDPDQPSLLANPAAGTAAHITVKALGKLDAYRVKELGAYLPTDLPAEYAFGEGYLYHIVMEDGTQGDLLFATYLNGEGKKLEHLRLAVMNYKPVTERQIYEPIEITREKLLETGGYDFYISYGEVYVGISTKNADLEDLLEMIQSING